MKNLLVMAALLLASLGASAAGGSYWVVGSFSSLETAQVERARIEQASSESVKVAKFDLPQGTMYRLLVAESGNASAQRSRLESAGVSPWSVALHGAELDFVGSDVRQKVAYDLVVGSFDDESHANALASRLSDQGFSMVETTRVSGDTNRYRVLIGPYDSRDASIKRKAEGAGITDAWWLATTVKAGASDQESAMSMPSKPNKETMPQTSTSMSDTSMSQPAEPAMPSITPPAPGENLVSYCVSKANAEERARYCTDDKFAAALSADKVRAGTASASEFVNFCINQANAQERAQYCNDEAFAAHLKQ